MIRNSFIFLDKISDRREQAIWEQGIEDWDGFLAEKSVSGITTPRKGHYDRQIMNAWHALDSDNPSYFHSLFPRQETWRLYPHFKDNACFLDIETTGYYGDITVVGIYDGNESHAFVRGFNLDKELLQKTLAQFDMILTFNGSSFDLPVIRRFFGPVLPEIPHIDLRHVCKRIGLVGGLKRIEEQLGIQRPEAVQGVTGADAVELWQRWKATGEKKHLETLVQYNEEDIVNLKPIANRVISQVWQQVRFGKNT